MMPILFPQHKCPMKWDENKLPSQQLFIEKIRWPHFHRWARKAGMNNNIPVNKGER